MDRRLDRRQPVLGILPHCDPSAVGGERPGVDTPECFGERGLAGPLGREPADPLLSLAPGLGIMLERQHEAVRLPPLDYGPRIANLLARIQARIQLGSKQEIRKGLANELSEEPSRDCPTI